MQSTILCAFGTPAIDTLFYAGAFNLGAHFRVIQQRAMRIRYGTGRHASDFRDLIIYHQNIIDLTEYLTQTFQPILLVHFTVSSVQICAIAYQLSLVVNLFLFRCELE